MSVTFSVPNSVYSLKYGPKIPDEFEICLNIFSVEACGQIRYPNPCVNFVLFCADDPHLNENWTYSTHISDVLPPILVVEAFFRRCSSVLGLTKSKVSWPRAAWR